MNAGWKRKFPTSARTFTRKVKDEANRDVVTSVTPGGRVRVKPQLAAEFHLSQREAERFALHVSAAAKLASGTRNAIVRDDEGDQVA